MHRLPFLYLRVIVRTVGLTAPATLGYPTLRCLVHERVILKFLPAVAGPAAILQLAAVLISLSVLLGFPAGALSIRILVGMRGSSVVLPVVCVDTNIPLVVLVREGTPHCLKVKHVKVSVSLESVKNVHGQFRFMMRESTDLTVFALVDLIWICGTKLSLILLGVIEVLNPVVTPDTVVALRALFLRVSA